MGAGGEARDIEGWEPWFLLVLPKRSVGLFLFYLVIDMAPYGILCVQMDNWSFMFGWIGLSAFLLAIPMSVAANLLTPKVKNWWAIKTYARATKRLAFLEARLEILKLYKEDSSVVKKRLMLD